MTDRTCGTCAWWMLNRLEAQPGDVDLSWPCEWAPDCPEKKAEQSCRYHATTRAWEEVPLGPAQYISKLEKEIARLKDLNRQLHDEVSSLKARCQDAREILSFIPFYSNEFAEWGNRVHAWLEVSDA